MSKSLIQQQPSLELKKHVNAIHCTNSLSLVQRKIANALLYNAYDELAKSVEHEITLGQLCRLIGYTSHDQQLIKRSLVGLISTVVEWNLLHDGVDASQEEWNASSIIASASIKSGICRYAYSPVMRRLLHTPAMYGRLNMQVQARFKSSYGLALYENAIRYQNLNHTPWLEMTIFRRLMGVGAEVYPVFRDFKRRVLDKALAEVNAYTSMCLEPEFKREKRQVVAIRFSIGKPTVTATKLISEQTHDLALSAQLHNEFGLGKRHLQRVLRDYSVDYIHEKISTVKKSPSFQQGKIQNLTSYLLAALQDDYQPAHNQVVAREQADLQQEQQDYQQRQLAAQEDARQKRYQAYLQQCIIAEFTCLPEQLQNTIEQSFQTHLQESKQTYVLRCLIKNHFDHPAVIAVFREFIAQHFPGVLNVDLSYEKYCSTVDIAAPAH